MPATVPLARSRCHTSAMQRYWPRSLLRFIVILGAAAIAQSITHSWWQFLIITIIVTPLWLLERRFLPTRSPRPAR